MTYKDTQIPEKKLLPETTISHLQDIERKFNGPEWKFGIILVRSANKVMSEAALIPIPKMLFDEFWHEGELCVLYADTGVGKSILGVQIGISIATGIQIPGFALEAPVQPVYYFDFELSGKQFQQRYSKDFQDNYVFPDNFYRGEMTPDEIPAAEKFETFLISCFEKAITKTGAKILIIDNLTRLTIGDTDHAKDAKPLMESLMRLKMKYNVSILAIEHNRKRDETKGISLNDLQGSAMKARFFDSAFTVGRSAQDPNLRYLMQKKERAKERKFDANNVAVCRIVKPGNFTLFKFIKLSREIDHLTQLSNSNTEKRLALALELRGTGIPNTQIAKQLGVTETAVRKMLRKYDTR